MALEKFKKILKKADKEGYGVGAFNISDIDTVIAVLKAAEEKKSPVIIQIWGGIFEYVDPEKIVPLTRELVKKAKVPAALHLDHAETLADIKNVIEYGFSSVMIDVSRSPFEENIERTKRVVEFAHERGIDVEAELGHVGSGSNSKDVEKEFLTRPEEAARFTERTNVDALAVAIGTAHGLYSFDPELDLECLKEIKKNVNVPLVLHGGSDTPDSEIQEAINKGISKINVATDLNKAFLEKLSEIINNENLKPHFPAVLMEPARQNVYKVVKKKIEVFASFNRA